MYLHEILIPGSCKAWKQKWRVDDNVTSNIKLMFIYDTDKYIQYI